MVHDRVEDEPETIDVGEEEKEVMVGSVALLTVTEIVEGFDKLFDVSLETADKECVALDAVVVSQEIEYGEVVSSEPMLLPSNLNCTPPTAILSEALAETETLPVTVAPLAGSVKETVGGVVSPPPPPPKTQVIPEIISG